VEGRALPRVTVCSKYYKRTGEGGKKNLVDFIRKPGGVISYVGGQRPVEDSRNQENRGKGNGKREKGINYVAFLQWGGRRWVGTDKAAGDPGGTAWFGWGGAR